MPFYETVGVEKGLSFSNTFLWHGNMYLYVCNLCTIRQHIYGHGILDSINADIGRVYEYHLSLEA